MVFLIFFKYLFGQAQMKVNLSVKDITSLNYHTNFERVNLKTMAMLGGGARVGEGCLINRFAVFWDTSCCRDSNFIKTHRS